MLKKKLNFSEKVIERYIAFFIILSLLVALSVHIGDNFTISTTHFVKPTTPINIKNNSKIEQELPLMKYDIIYELNILFGTYGRRNTGNIIVEFMENEKIIQKWNIPSNIVIDNQFHRFKFEHPLTVNKNARYKFLITEVYNGENVVAILTGNDKKSIFSVDGKKFQSKAICYSVSYKIQNLKDTVRLFCICIFSVLFILIVTSIDELSLMILFFSLIICSYLSICPPGMEPDADAHFFRAYEIANVSLVSKHVNGKAGGNYLPATLSEFRNTKITIDKNNTRIYEFPGSALYCPISYLPQALGIKIGGLFTDRPFLLYYSGKCASAFASLLLCISALSLVPFGRKVLFIVITFPLTLQEMVSMAPDGFIISLSILFLSYILKLSYTENIIKKRDVILLFIIGITIALCKIIYIVLLFLVLIIPNSRFVKRSNAVIFKVGIIIICCLLNLVWLKISSEFLVEFVAGVDSIKQANFIVSNLVTFYRICLRTIFFYMHDWILTMIGGSMGALNIKISTIIWLFFSFLFIYEICNYYEEKIKQKKYDSLILLVTFLMGSILIFVSLYVQWTPLKSSIIFGVQGRYFTPLIGIFAYFIILSRHKKVAAIKYEYQIDKPNTIFFLIILCCNCVAVSDIMKYYLDEIHLL